MGGLLRLVLQVFHFMCITVSINIFKQCLTFNFFKSKSDAYTYSNRYTLKSETT